LNIIELPKADRLGVAASDLAAWVAYFKHWRENTTMNQITHPPVQEALAHLQALSADAETRRRAFVRERALRDEISELQGARREGREEGIQQGLDSERRMLLRQIRRRFGAAAAGQSQPLLERIQQPNAFEDLGEALLDSADATVWQARLAEAARPPESPEHFPEKSSP
jgi:hypothetical protein